MRLPTICLCLLCARAAAAAYCPPASEQSGGMTDGLKLPNEDRLTDNSNRSRAVGLDVEMELNGRERTQWQSRWNLQQ